MPQLINRDCALCGQRISSLLDARFCHRCASPIHNGCVKVASIPADQLVDKCPVCGVDSASAIAPAGLHFVYVRCSGDPYFGYRWHIQRTSDGLVLYDHRGQFVVKIANELVSVRVLLPSFWASVQGIVIVEETGALHRFDPHPEAVAGLRKLIDECLSSAPEAAGAMQGGIAARILLAGCGSLAVGVLITVGSFLYPSPDGTIWIATGLIGTGAGEIIWGIHWHRKARRLISKAARSN